MHALRSRTGVVSITVGAAVLLALPVVAAGQVPGVGQVVGGVKETAESIAPVPLPAPAAPPTVNAPDAPAPGVQNGPPPAAQAPAARQDAGQAPSAGAPAAPRGAAPAASSSAAGSAAKATAAQGGGSGRADGASDAPARASQDDSGGESADSGATTAVADLSDDAGADTLPFTGLQLMLVLMSGLAALAGGFVIRRSARSVRR